ncbi:nitroreductase family protein [Croceibacter atlanticus]|uniref:nitroreductase family protein n=1 Tax=Croceibacter atlanticus TaxID=313588 RepID=UPI0030D907ED|tara:strand:- start:90026 stop:91009 length:984 start_codon:yes stop_codon:yes gene_type:complete
MLHRVKRKIHAIVFWQTRLGEFVNKVNDLKLFYKYSFTQKKIKSKESYQAFLTKQYHIVEKGLALPNPRKGFGKAKILLLINKANEYNSQYPEDRLIRNVKETLQEYLNRNPQLYEVDLEYYSTIINFINNNRSSLMGGVKPMNFKDIKSYTDINYEDFVKSRTSVRNYSKVNVLKEDVKKAVELARFTPSVCNRQSWQVHYFRDKEMKNQLLSLQGGNNGFTDSINQLLIVTGDTRKFTQLESNQLFIDGGLFAMNLLLGLHAQHIASCCLNTCLPFTIENKIKSLGNIPRSERLIMMIGIGNFKDSFEVAISNRKIINEILVEKV